MISSDDVVAGFSATFLLWTLSLAYAASYAVYKHRCSYMRWCAIERDSRVKLALWLGIPLIMYGLFWMRGVTTWGILSERFNGSISVKHAVGYMPPILLGLSLVLWWSFDRTYGSTEGDRRWFALTLAGVILGFVVGFLNWRF